MSIREDLKAFVDGELSPERAAQVQAAIDADPGLQQEVTFMKLLSRTIQESAHSPEPAGVEETLRAVAPPPRRRPWYLQRTTLQLAAAGAVVFLLAVVFFPVFAQSKYSAKRVSDSAVSMKAVASAPMDGAYERARNGSAGFAPPASPRAQSGGEKAKAFDLAGEAAAPMPEFGPRSIVRNATLSVRVKSAAEAQAYATTMAQGLGGFVERSDLSALTNSDPIATVTLRVPERRFDEAMKALRALGEVESESVSGEDVTGQIVDVEARLRTLRQEEEQYRQILRNTRRIGEVLEVRDRLGQVRQQIEVLTAQRASLRNLAALSTINAQFNQRVSLQDEKPSGGWAEDTWAGAVKGLQGVGRFLGQTAITLFVYCPIWLPVVILIWFLVRKSKSA